MSRRNKLEQLRTLGLLPNVLEKPTQMAGQWQKHFERSQPLVVELGCGYGEYTIALAQRYPQRNYLGIDIQGERLWRGAQASLELKLKNVLWLRAYIDQLADYFAPGEITELWLTFPDPYPKERHIKKRLTSLKFLQLYRQLLIPEGKVHLKTDARSFIEYTQSVLEDSDAQLDMLIENVVAGDASHDLDIVTRFEQKHRTLNEPIYYLAWHWPKQ